MTVKLFRIVHSVVPTFHIDLPQLKTIGLLAFSYIHCKNKLVEITHFWLPELQNCNSGNQKWVISTHLFLQCKPPPLVAMEICLGVFYNYKLFTNTMVS